MPAASALRVLGQMEQREDVCRIHGAGLAPKTFNLDTEQAVQQHMTSSHPGPIHHTRTKIGTRQEGPPGSERGREEGSFPQPARNQHGGQRWGVSCSSASDGPTAVPGCSHKPQGLQRFQSGMKAN